jgi:hypothetical protein
MDKDEYNIFRVFIELSRDFVEKHNGVWSHAQWQEFLSIAEKSGIPVVAGLESYLGDVVESMKDFYTHLDRSIGITNAMMNMAEHTIRMIIDTNGVWDQVKWDNFISDYQYNKVLLELRDESIANLGRILEASRIFYEALFNLYRSR